ncbi:MAG: ROK family protein [Hydrogenoanaerobacterium sp.]
MKTIALDIGGTSIKAGIIENGILCSQQELATDALLGGEAVIKKVENIISGFDGFDCIGVSTAGQVDSLNGSIRFANENIPHYTGMQIKSRLQKAFNVPVAVENDVNSAAVGEAHFGAGRGISDFLCITYGTGVGGAIVLNGNIYSGSSFSAAEFGHLITHAGGEACNCGQRGCYERYASAGALVRKAKQLSPALTSGREIFAHFNEPAVKELVDEWITEILYGLTSLVHIFNPSLLVLGGGIMNEPYIIDELRKKLPACTMPSYHNVSIKNAELKNNAGLWGAAYLAEKLFYKTVPVL